MLTRGRFLFVLALLSQAVPALADWPMLHGNAQHSGFVQAGVKPPFRLAWVREFFNERIGTAVEPIVARDKVFIATHRGNLYALQSQRGEPIWRFESPEPFLHSPAFADGLVVAASTDGNLYAIDADSGELRWRRFIAHGGFSASPLIAEGKIFIGARSGVFAALALQAGELLWLHDEGDSNVPIRQTAAFYDSAVYVAGEDLRLRRFAVKEDPTRRTALSQPMPGQTARDYYPVIVKHNGRAFVIARTNPILNMAQRIGRDRTLLCRNAGVDDSGWQKVDAWTKSEAARGTPDLWKKEQETIRQYLETNRTAQSFFVFSAESTLREESAAPVLWIGGCQSVGAMPAATENGDLLVFYRSAYGNWNRGVAPLVALGLFNPNSSKIAPLFHQQGRQPAWNCFWGTADESQNFVVAGTTALIVHQGTLSGFDLKEKRLFPIHGERDTYGGLRSPPWARNEWHGPARSGVAVDNQRIYWLTGSRLLCLASGEQGEPAQVSRTDGKSVPARRAPHIPPPSRNELRERLHKEVHLQFSTRWAPFFVDPGLAGRDFSFDDSGELFEAVAWSFPHLSSELQNVARQRLADEWREHAPFLQAGWYALNEGRGREWFQVPGECRARVGADRPPHPFGNMYAVWLYAERCGESERVMADWPKLKQAFADFARSNWRLDPDKGDLYANRYLASLIALARLAQTAGDRASAAEAGIKADETAEALVQWWKRAAQRGTLELFKGSQELDPFIGKGDGISHAIGPHRHKLALFKDLTPEVAGLINAKAPEAVSEVWAVFSMLYRTWPLVGEERQVHSGENFIDPPDLALGGFQALAWLRNGSAEELARRVDLPGCRADLYYVTKLAIALEAMSKQL